MTEAARRNFLPSDPHRDNIDDLFEEARTWIDGSKIENQATADKIAILLDMARKAANAADESRIEEKKPHDLAGKEIQARYGPILDRAALITIGCKKLLTEWRDQLAAQQEREAAEQRRIAEAARVEAERVADVAKGSIEAEAVAKGAAEIAERFEKQATKLEKNAGRGLRMRTVRSGEIVDLKEVIAHFYRAERKWMQQTMQTRVDAELKRSSTPIPGVVVTVSKEAF